MGTGDSGNYYTSGGSNVIHHPQSLAQFYRRL